MSHRKGPLPYKNFTTVLRLPDVHLRVVRQVLIYEYYNSRNFLGGRTSNNFSKDQGLLAYECPFLGVLDTLHVSDLWQDATIFRCINIEYISYYLFCHYKC